VFGVRVALAASAILVLLAGCGGSSGPKTLDALWKGAGEQVSLVAGTSDFGVGDVRLSFLVVDQRGKPVYTPRATVWLAPRLESAPLQRTTASLEPVGPPGTGGDGADATHLYVAHLTVSKPGTWWVLARPDGAKIGAVGNLVVHARTASPAVGSKAYPSRTPTLASTHGDTAALTTRVPPDRSLLRYSVAGSLRAHKPFVLLFATPKFCQSRTCGPVTDVVLQVQKREPSIRFIHVEIYKDNVVAEGQNRWVKEWRLPSEPWLFLVGRDGRIKGKFEGSFSAGELESAIATQLLPR
jgi:hypothetical protein